MEIIQHNNYNTTININMQIFQHNNYNTTIKCMAMIKKDTQDLKTTELKLSKKRYTDNTYTLNRLTKKHRILNEKLLLQNKLLHNMIRESLKDYIISINDNNNIIEELKKDVYRYYLIDSYYILNNSIIEHVNQLIDMYMDNQFKYINNINDECNCVICLDKIFTAKECITCKKLFHKECLKLAISRNIECPHCRTL